MSTQFYLTLPSNSSMKYFPHNTVANFRVKLADGIVLPGQWEVALTGLHYPHTWSTVRPGVQQTFTYKVESKGHFETGVLKSTQFNTPTDLVKAINASMIKESQAKIKFTYNRSTRKVTVDVKQGAMVWITGDIAAVLGFGKDSVLTEKMTSPFVADINRGFSSMYVYTDIVDAQFVGDVKVTLLRIVNTEGKYGNNVHASFCNLQYVPVKVNAFETIEVNIKNDRDENFHLSLGSQ